MYIYMSIICDELNKKTARLKKQQQEINRNKLAMAYGLDPNKYDPKEVVDYLVSRHNVDRNALNSFMADPDSTVAGFAKKMESANKVNQAALDNAKSLSTKDGIKNFAEAIRKNSANLINKALKSIPDGVSNSTKAFMQQVTGTLDIQIGSTKDGNGVWAGHMTAREIKVNGEELLKNDEFLENAGKFTKTQLGNAANIAGFMRGMDVQSTIASDRKYIKDNMNTKPVLKNWLPALDLLEKANKSKAFRDFMDDYFSKLDVAAEYGEKNKILKNKHADYYHNAVDMEAFRNPWEEGIFSSRMSKTDFTKAKQYKSGNDFMLSGGSMPASMDFFDVSAAYWKQYGNAVNRIHMAEFLKENSKLGKDHDSKMTIVDSDGVQHLTVMRNFKDEKWEAPQAGNGNRYRNMGAFSHVLDGIYAHPDFYDWAQNAIGQWKAPNGIVMFAMKTNEMLKGITLSLGFGPISFHGMALAQKGLLAGRQAGVAGYWQIGTMQGEGASAMANHDAGVLNLINHGLTVETPDMLRQTVLSNKFDPETGDKRIYSKIADSITSLFNFQHENLFDKFAMPYKVGLALRMTKTEWFKNIADNKGHDHAFETVAKIMNDTMGGQNLQMMGRSKALQTLLRASMLAPDWQEGKFRRLFGVALAENPDVRKAYQGAVLTEVIALAVGHMAAQQAWWAMTGSKKGMDDMFLDWANGKLGIINLGTTKDGYAINARVAGSSIEDIRPVTGIIKAYHDAITGHTYEGTPSPFKELPDYQKVYKPAVKDVGHEAVNKLSPIARFMFDAMQHLPTARKGKPGQEPRPKDPSGYDYPYLPIAVQAAVKAACGGYGKSTEDREKYTALALISSMSGFPIESVKESSGDKGRKTEKPKKLSYLR